MKNKIIFVLVLLFSLVLVGCGKDKKDPEVDPQEPDKPNTEFETQFETIKKKLDESVPYFVTEDIELMTEYPEYDALIEWETSNYDLLNVEGNVDPIRNKAVEVTLTYNVIIGENSKKDSINVIVSPVTVEKVAERFSKQFSNLITRDYKINTKFYDLFEVEWTSSNTECFTNEGIYIKPIDDTEVDIKYVIRCKDYTSEEMVKKVTVAGVSDLERINEINKYIKEEVLSDLYFTDGVTLPSVYKKYNVPIVWESSNPDVVSVDGKINHFVYERYVTLVARYTLPNGSGGTTKCECIVSPLDITKMTKTEIVDNFLDSIALKEYAGVKFGYSECPVLSTTYGHLYFYQNKEYPVTDMMIPVGTSNRGQRPMDVQMIVVHDTANYNASAKANASWCQNGCSGSGTSWHYTIGNDGIFQTLPDNECGGHANGSWTQKFKMIDTEIKATARKPQTSIDEEGYIYVNQQKTNIKVPDPSRRYADFGIMVEIGKNGNYYVADSWYCSANGQNAVIGGNGNGIGIETSTQQKTDYMLTVRMLAKHIANLLIKHKLPIARVVQHNTTSGKNCPQAIREANFWYTLKDYISLELFAKTYLKDCQFVWKSNTDIMSDNGAISLDLKDHTSVTYSVIVSDNEKQLVSHSYTTVLSKAK